MAGKLYTGKGDRGETRLIGGRAVPKEAPRVEAYGDVDELSSHLGLVQADLPEAVGPVREVLERLQHELFILGAELATPPGHAGQAHRLEARHVRRLEQEIDLFAEPLKDLKTFVLPRGSRTASELHICRTVARRAERSILRLHRQEPQRPEVLEYINRLSSLLFALAVLANRTAGVAEIAPDYTR